MKAPVVSGKEVLKALQKEGFSIVRQRGSHAHLEKKDGLRTLHVTVPLHGNEDLNPFVLKSIARQAGYEFEAFARLFGR